MWTMICLHLDYKQIRWDKIFVLPILKYLLFDYLYEYGNVSYGFMIITCKLLIIEFNKILGIFLG